MITAVSISLSMHRRLDPFPAAAYLMPSRSGSMPVHVHGLSILSRESSGELQSSGPVRFPRGVDRTTAAAPPEESLHQTATDHYSAPPSGATSAPTPRPKSPYRPGKPRIVVHPFESSAKSLPPTSCPVLRQERLVCCLYLIALE